MEGLIPLGKKYGIIIINEKGEISFWAYFFMELELNKALELFEELRRDIENVIRCVKFLKSKNAKCKIYVHTKSITSEEASKALCCDIDEIVKSIVIVNNAGDSKLLLLQGNSRINFGKFRGFRLANAEEISKITGFRIGSVSSFDIKIPILMDKKLFEKDNLRPACGSTCVGLEISPQELKRVCNAKTEDISG